MTRILRALPSQFALILPATAILYLVSPLLAEGSVSGSSILIVFSFASILAIAAIGQTLVVQQGGLDLSVPGVISLAAVLVTNGGFGAFDEKVDAMAVQYRSMGMAIGNSAKHKTSRLLAQRLETEGVYLGEGGLSVEEVRDNWDKIADPSKQEAYPNGAGQTGKMLRKMQGG